MNKTLLSLALAFAYNVNAQTIKKNLETTLNSNPPHVVIKHLETAPTQVTVNATLGNSNQGYIWGPLGFPSSSIVRMGKDFSTVIFKVDGLPLNVRFLI